MLHRGLIILFLFLPLVIQAQVVELPPDFRQHNLTEYNSSLLSPIFSLDRNQPESLALWTRWQWQSIDGDPTTYLFNYTHRFNRQSAAGIGFFQHNTGLFLQTGAIVNYAYGFDLGKGMQLAFGLNVLGYQRKPSDNRYQPNPDVPLPPLFDVSNDFILQIAPSVRFRYDKFSIGLVGENLLDYNFSKSGQETAGSDKIYIALASYQFPVFIFGSSETSYIQPTLYMKTLPGMDDQYGITSLFSTPKFWVQLGYNDFYGISGGVGGRFFKHLSIGALMESGSSSAIAGSNTSIELITAYTFGPGDIRGKVVGFDTGEEEEVLVPPAEEARPSETEALAEQQEAEARSEQIRDSIALVREQEAMAAARALQEEREIALSKRQRDSLAKAELAMNQKKKQTLDSLAEVRRQANLATAMQQEEQRRLDSVAKVQRQAELAAAQGLEDQRRRDSVAQAAVAQQAVEDVAPEPGEKYEESTTADGLVPGFYLIANVFGTKKYFEAFMKTLKGKGLDPKSFYRNVNKYNYVYLQRYNTIEDARQARNSKFDGKYSEDLWIFRVVPD